MQPVLPGVFVVPMNGNKGFGYAHLVRRPAGNLLLDASRTASMSDAFAAIEAEGGVRALVISDRHLGGGTSEQAVQRFGATVYCSVIEAEAMGHRTNQVTIHHILPFERTTIEGDVLLVPTPGHTPGQFSTLAEVEGAKILFTADFVWREGGRWRPGNLSRKKMRASFDGLRDLAFDYVVPWTSYSQDELFVPIRSVPEAVEEMIAACSKP
jgi:glyoxylase-like metal-dependent hydrolase (beta-lactamase superfamily II)